MQTIDVVDLAVLVEDFEEAGSQYLDHTVPDLDTADPNIGASGKQQVSIITAKRICAPEGPPKLKMSDVWSIPNTVIESPLSGDLISPRGGLVDIPFLKQVKWAQSKENL